MKISSKACIVIGFGLFQAFCTIACQARIGGYGSQDVGETVTGANSGGASGSTPKAPFIPQGTDRGNGADDPLPEENSAWFARAERSIRFCMVFAPDYGGDAEKSRKAASVGLSTWLRYVNDKRLFSFSGTEVGLATSAVEMKNCDGTEDLKFNFGIRDQEVNRRIKQFERPWSFAARTKYDLFERWGKGFIYIAKQGELGSDNLGPMPDWNVEGSLDAILLHEIGHIFVAGHYEGTIMTDQIVALARYWQNNNTYRRKLITSMIDHEKQLVHLVEESYSGRLGIIQNRPTGAVDGVRSNFEALVGRAPQGRVLAQVKTIRGIPVELAVLDGIAQETFVLERIPGASMSGIHVGDAFKIVYGTKQPSGEVYRFPFVESMSGASYLMKLTTKSGDARLIQVDRNISNYPEGHVDADQFRSDHLTIKWVGLSGSEYLFVSLL